MKKYIVSLVIALAIMLVPMTVKGVELPEVTDHEKVTVYLFYKSTCTYCHNFIDYFANSYVDYTDYFEIKTYQIDKESDDYLEYNLEVAVAEALGEEGGYVPLIVIGDEYYSLGFSGDGEEVIEAALEAYEDEDYVDLVANIAEDNDITVAAEDFTTACSVVGTECAGMESSGLSDGIIIAIIFGVVIIGFGSLVIFSRKK